MEERRAEMVGIEAELFAAFSESVGVEDIAQFEEKRLRVAEEHLAQRTALTDRVSRLRSQVEYEAERDLAKPLKEVEAKVTETRSTLEGLEKEAKKASADVAEQKKETEALEKALKASRDTAEAHSKLWKSLKKEGAHPWQFVN